MLQAWRDASKHCTPTPRIPQTLIVGTERARASLSPSFSGLFRRSQSALTCDVSTLRLMKRDPKWRYIAVVQSTSELRSIIDLVETPNSSNFVIAVVTANEETVCAIRMAALHTGGLGLVAGGRSLLVVQQVLEAWVGRELVEEGVFRKAFGDAALGKEVVVPPAWDSEAKIRAVTDALGIDYDLVAQNTGAVEESKLVIPADEGKERRKASEAKRKFLQEHQNWLNGVAARLESEKQDGCSMPRGHVENVSQVSQAEEAPVQSDFFQRLLSEKKL